MSTFDCCSSFIQKIEFSDQDPVYTMAFDHFAKYLALCSSDQSIKILQAIHNEYQHVQRIPRGEHSTGHTHTSSLRHICFAPPLFGCMFASVSIDGTLNIFELRASESQAQDDTHAHTQSTLPPHQQNAAHAFSSAQSQSQTSSSSSGDRFAFVRVAAMSECVDVISCEFCPSHLGLQLAIVCGDGVIKLMQACDVTNLAQWTVAEQIVINARIMPAFPLLSFKHDNILKKERAPQPQNVEAVDAQLNANTKVFCMSWNSSKWEAPTFCCGANHGRIFIYGHTTATSSNSNGAFTKTWNCLLQIALRSGDSGDSSSSDICSVSWANHLARKYHLIACGSSDGCMRVIAVHGKKPQHGANAMFEWNLVFERNIDCGGIRRLKWNLSATALLSAAEDGRVYLWQKERNKYAYTHQCLSTSRSRPQQQQRPPDAPPKTFVAMDTEEQKHHHNNHSGKNGIMNGFVATTQMDEDQSMLDYGAFASKPHNNNNNNHGFAAFSGAFSAAQYRPDEDMDNRSDNDVVQDIKFVPQQQQPIPVVNDRADNNKNVNDDDDNKHVIADQPVTDAGTAAGFPWSQPAQDNNNAFGGFGGFGAGGGGFDFGKTQQTNDQNTGFSFASTPAWNNNSNDNNDNNHNGKDNNDNQKQNTDNKKSEWGFGGAGGGFANW